MKSVYTGGEKVADFNNWDELRLGANHPAFIWQGDKLVYPNPVMDGLVLFYDFSGMTNSDKNRGIATDLSGNGNHGTLQNFNYTAESGYDKNKLLFDGVDDKITVPHTDILNPEEITVNLVITPKNTGTLQSILSKRSYINDGYNMFILSSGTIYFDWGGGGINRWSVSNVVKFDEKLFISFTHKDSITKLFLNGVLEREISRDINLVKSLSDLVFGLDTYTNIYPSRSIYHSVRIYNRPLTPEEIAHNYAIEKERFGIE